MTEEEKPAAVDRKPALLNWTTLITAMLGLAGGALSGGFAAYTQLSTSQEQFSIQRAQMFRELIDDLQKEEKARMALLNLWQLYPAERDKKIIVVAAIETGQPDLVETMIGFEDELAPLAEILQAKAASGDPNVKAPALETLVRVDPGRGAEVMVNALQDDIRHNGDRYVNTKTVFELAQLARTNEDVTDMIRDAEGTADVRPLLFDYILYRAGESSDFMGRLTTAYKETKNLDLFNDFLGNSDFKTEDVPTVVNNVRSYVVGALEDKNANRFELAGALVGLKNNALAGQLTYQGNQDLAESLSAAVTDASGDDRVREKALSLLRRISRHQALRAVARVLADGSAGRILDSAIRRQLAGGLIASLRDEDPGFKAPAHCAGAALDACIVQKEKWKEWLQDTGKKPQ